MISNPAQQDTQTDILVSSSCAAPGNGPFSQQTLSAGDDNELSVWVLAG